MKKIPFLAMIILSCSYLETRGQSNVLHASSINIEDSLLFKGQRIDSVSNDTSSSSTGKYSLITEFAAKKYADQHIGSGNGTFSIIGDTLKNTISSSPNMRFHIGNNLYESKGASSIAIGNNIASWKGGNAQVGIGNGVYVGGSYSVAIGAESSAQNRAVAIGSYTNANSDWSVVIGNYASSAGLYSLAIGSSASANGNYPTSIGFNATAVGNYSVALGPFTKAVNGATVLGRYNYAFAGSDNNSDVWKKILIVGGGTAQQPEDNYYLLDQGAYWYKPMSQTAISTIQTNASGSLKEALQLYNADKHTPQFYDGAQWRSLAPYNYSPSSSNDSSGALGDVGYDDNYIYIKTSSGWKRTTLASF